MIDLELNGVMVTISRMNIVIVIPDIKALGATDFTGKLHDVPL